MRNSTTAWILAIALPLLVVCRFVEADAIEIEPPSPKHRLAAADMPVGGPALVAWKAADEPSSRLEVHQGSAVFRSWSFPGLLIKDARWLQTGDRLALGIVGDEGPDHRIYRVDSLGDLHLEWSSAPLMRTYDSVALNRDGSRWLAAGFDVEAARIALGSTGSTEPLWTHTISAEEVGRASLLTAQEFSSATFLEGPPGGVAILWGGRLWLLAADGTGLERVRGPQGCRDIQSVWTTKDGLWFECYHGLDAEPGVTWTFLSAVSDERLVTSALSSPRFLADGRVVEMQRGEPVTVSVIDEDESGKPVLRSKGQLDLRSARGVQLAGEHLLLRQGTSERYRSLPINGGPPSRR